MVITKSNRIVINKIMYSLSISITPFNKDDGTGTRKPYTIWFKQANL